MKQHLLNDQKTVILFEAHDDDVSKAQKLHHALMPLNLPAHISIEVMGELVTIQGNVLDSITYETMIDFFKAIEGVTLLNERILVARHP